MHDHRALDLGAWLSAGVAVTSWAQGVAVGVTIVAGLISIILGIVRIHDRIKYGPAPRD